MLKITPFLNISSVKNGLTEHDMISLSFAVNKVFTALSTAGKLLDINFAIILIKLLYPEVDLNKSINKVNGFTEVP